MKSQCAALIFERFTTDILDWMRSRGEYVTPAALERHFRQLIDEQALFKDALLIIVCRDLASKQATGLDE